MERVYLAKPYNIKDCNDCKWLNITENEQQLGIKRVIMSASIINKDSNIGQAALSIIGLYIHVTNVAGIIAYKNEF